MKTEPSPKVEAASLPLATSPEGHAPACSPSSFDFLVTAMAASYDASAVRPPCVRECFRDIYSHLDGLKVNTPPECLLEDLAAAAAAIHRLAAIAVAQITPERMAQIIDANQPHKHTRRISWDDAIFRL